MKTLNVVAAIIKKDNQILATKRGYGEFINMWEFPGGKIENNETKEEALIREIKEELDTEIAVGDYLKYGSTDIDEYEESENATDIIALTAIDSNKQVVAGFK